jgi:orotate phosphoribosyltransferase
MTSEKLIADKLIQAGALQLSPNQPFTWASGWKSPIYCDNRKVLSYPFLRDFIKSEMCNVIFEGYPTADAICGVATAGISWGAMCADQLKLPFIYCRPEPKKHGMGNQVEGFFKEGQNIVVVEDLISTGKSSLQVAEVLRNNKLNVVGMVGIFNYGFAVADEAFKQANIVLKTLTNYQSLLALCLQQAKITEDEKQLLEEWRISPSTWGQ